MFNGYIHLLVVLEDISQLYYEIVACYIMWKLLNQFEPVTEPTFSLLVVA